MKENWKNRTVCDWFSWCLGDIKISDLGKTINWWTLEEEHNCSLFVLLEVINLDCSDVVSSLLLTHYACISSIW